jgi:peptidoglycan/LPS O-acetylase OafA/YrhL
MAILSQASASSGPRVAALDVLRAVAVTLVILYHCTGEASAGPGWPEAAREVLRVVSRGSWIGVDLFFVLSGFLVSGLLFREYRARGTVSAGRFLVRRGFKIYPPFYVMLAYGALRIFTLGVPASEFPWMTYLSEAAFV